MLLSSQPAEKEDSAQREVLTTPKILVAAWLGGDSVKGARCSIHRKGPEVATSPSDLLVRLNYYRNFHFPERKIAFQRSAIFSRANLNSYDGLWTTWVFP